MVNDTINTLCVTLYNWGGKCILQFTYDLLLGAWKGEGVRVISLKHAAKSRGYTDTCAVFLIRP